MSNKFTFEDWVGTVNDFRKITKHVPAAVRDDIIKARYKPEEAERGPKSLVWDPISIQYSLGYKDRKNSVTFDLLKRIPKQLSIIAAIIQTRCNQVASFAVPYRLTKSLGFTVKHKDPGHLTTKGEMEMIKDIESFIYNCGNLEPNPHNNDPWYRDDFEGFLKKLVRDSLLYDQACFEVVPDRRGLPYEFLAVDSSTIRIAAPKGSLLNPANNLDPRAAPAINVHPSIQTPYKTLALASGIDNPAYIQVINGNVQNVYSKEELAFGVRNPRTDIYIQGYGFGELEQLITIVTSHLYAEEYNRRFFMQGSAPKGMLVFKGDAMDPGMLEGFKRQWRANLEGVSNCLAGSTRIYTRETGFSSLEEICGGKAEVPVQLWTGEEWAPGLVYKTEEPKQLCRTKFDNNTVVSSSPDHKFRVIGESGDPEWVTQENLREGDVVLYNKKDPYDASLKKEEPTVSSWRENYDTVSIVSVENTGLYVPMYDVSVDTVDHSFVAENIVVHNSWKTPIFQSEQGIEWHDLNTSNREMEFSNWMEYLIKISCAVFLIDPAELNFDLHGGVSQTPLFESSQEWKLKASRDRGLKPMLRFLAKLINQNIVSQIDDHFVFDFVGLDELTEQEKHELRKEQVSSYMTLNEIRRAEDLPDVEHGDTIMNPTYLQAMQIAQQEEQQQQQAAAQPAAVDGGGAPAEEEGEEGSLPQEDVAPEYADSFSKGISLKSEDKYLEISLDDFLSE